MRVFTLVLAVFLIVACGGNASSTEGNNPYDEMDGVGGSWTERAGAAGARGDSEEMFRVDPKGRYRVRAYVVVPTQVGLSDLLVMLELPNTRQHFLPLCVAAFSCSGEFDVGISGADLLSGEVKLSVFDDFRELYRLGEAELVVPAVFPEGTFLRADAGQLVDSILFEITTV